MQAAHEIVDTINRVCASHTRPIVVALDGGSGAGKSTIAAMVQRQTGAAHVLLDDFYNTSVPEADLLKLSVRDRLQAVFDWERVRRCVLEPLRAGRAGQWYAFDFLAGLRQNGAYGLRSEVTELAPAPIILLEGSYSASPELADLIDLAVLIDVPVQERYRRVAVRDEAAFSEQWHRIWDDVETYYFTHVRPAKSFDLIVSNEPVTTLKKND
jgi:uridine kinase